MKVLSGPPLPQNPPRHPAIITYQCAAVLTHSTANKIALLRTPLLHTPAGSHRRAGFGAHVCATKVNLSLCVCCRPVACSPLSQPGHLRGHMQGVLRGLRHLQLPGVPAELPQQPVPQPGAHAGGAAAAATPAPAVLLPTVAHGRVRGGRAWGRYPADGWILFKRFSLVLQ